MNENCSFAPQICCIVQLKTAPVKKCQLSPHPVQIISRSKFRIFYICVAIFIVGVQNEYLYLFPKIKYLFNSLVSEATVVYISIYLWMQIINDFLCRSEIDLNSEKNDQVCQSPAADAITFLGNPLFFANHCISTLAQCISGQRSASAH